MSVCSRADVILKGPVGLPNVAFPAPLRPVITKAIWKQKPSLVQQAHGLLGVNSVSFPYE
jgi:hypothetical protein